MRSNREVYEEKLRRVADIVRTSGGISVFTLSRAIGETVSNTKKLVRALRVDGVLDYDLTRVEERHVQRGPRPYLLVAK